MTDFWMVLGIFAFILIIITLLFAKIYGSNWYEN